VSLSVGLTSFLACAGAYAVAVALILVGRAQHRYKLLMLTACAITAIWSAATAAQYLVPVRPTFLPFAFLVLEHLRAAAWIAVLAFSLHVAYGRRIGWAMAGGLAAAVTWAMAYSLIVTAAQLWGGGLSDLILRGIYLAQLVVAVIGLLLIENLFRNSAREARWSVKYLCFGVGMIFSYDFFVYAQGALLGNIDYGVYAARGIITALAMPLIIVSAARSKRWPIDVHVSRAFVFHSATLLAGGVYLMAMAGVGYSLRILDGPWGTISQATFLMAAALVLAVILSSGAMQARFKTFISHNFFSLRYDYRVEWLRFIDAISSSATNLTIPERVGHALANIIGSTAGAIWVKHDSDGMFRVMACWGMTDVPGEIPKAEPWLDRLAACPGVVDLERCDVDGREAFRAELPAWLLSHPLRKSMLPLMHEQHLVGFVVLGAMRAPRALDWEDFELLKTAARQAASYIAEDAAAQALSQVRRFEDFNQRFAFIVHDVKNLAAQMTLILRNADRHGDNPEFQKDMIQTIRGSVGRLRTMLEQLKGAPATDAPAQTIDLAGLLRGLTMEWKLQLPGLEIAVPQNAIYIEGLAEPLHAVIGHLIQNAADAAGPNGHVQVGLSLEGPSREDPPPQGPGPAVANRWAAVTVADDGPGMNRQFIETQLFQPLRSGKAAGFGIGAFQARQITRGMGGNLVVESECGHGTRITVRLPCVSPA
jgi:putative PEP-CTERM system histidine kinase